MMRALQIGAAVCTVALLAQASAFIPPSSFIFRRLAAKLSGLRGVTAKLGGFLEAEGAALPADGKLYAAGPDRMRLELAAGAARWTEVWGSGRKTIVRGGGAPERGTFRVPHPLAGLFLGAPRAYVRDLGVDASVVTLGRLHGTICWVIGAKPDDGTRPSVWIDKETFLPVRVRYFEGEGDGRREMDWRFEAYDAGASFPRTLELRIAQKRVLRVGLVELDTSRVPSESTFTASP